MANIKCGKCKGTHETVAEVRACYGQKPSTTTVSEAYGGRQSANANGRLPNSQRTTTGGQPMVSAKEGTDPFGEPVAANPASEKQLAFIAKLRSERGYAAPAEYLETMTKKQASQQIEALLAEPKVARSFVAPAGEPEDGIYVVKGDDPVAYSYVDRQDLVPFRQDAIYKVYKMVHGSGRQGVKRLVRTVHPAGHTLAGQPKGSFAYLGLATKHLPEAAVRVSLEEAKKYGSLYGFCVKCGATLTDEGSIAAGIGPVCVKGGW